MVTYDRNWMSLLECGDAFVTVGDDEVMIVAQTDKNGIIFSQASSDNYVTLSLPRATVEKYELPEIVARRELKTTYGYHAMDMQFVGTLNPSIRYEDGQSNIYLTWQTHVFLAKNLVSANLKPEMVSSMVIKEVAFEHIDEVMLTGEFGDSTTVAVLDLTRKHLEVQEQFNLLDVMIVSR